MQVGGQAGRKRGLAESHGQLVHVCNMYCMYTYKLYTGVKTKRGTRA
jgi:hypothetical protein